MPINGDTQTPKFRGLRGANRDQLVLPDTRLIAHPYHHLPASLSSCPLGTKDSANVPTYPVISSRQKGSNQTPAYPRNRSAIALGIFCVPPVYSADPSAREVISRSSRKTSECVWVSLHPGRLVNCIKNQR